MPAYSGRQTEGNRGTRGDKPIDKRHQHRVKVDLPPHSRCQRTQDDRLKDTEERQETSLSTRDTDSESRWICHHTHDARVLKTTDRRTERSARRPANRPETPTQRGSGLANTLLCQRTQDDRLKGTEERQETSPSTRDTDTERRWTYHHNCYASVLRTIDRRT